MQKEKKDAQNREEFPKDIFYDKRGVERRCERVSKREEVKPFKQRIKQVIAGLVEIEFIQRFREAMFVLILCAASCTFVFFATLFLALEKPHLLEQPIKILSYFMR